MWQSKAVGSQFYLSLLCLAHLPVPLLFYFPSRVPLLEFQTGVRTEYSEGFLCFFVFLSVYLTEQLTFKGRSMHMYLFVLLASLSTMSSISFRFGVAGFLPNLSVASRNFSYITSAQCPHRICSAPLTDSQIVDN